MAKEEKLEFFFDLTQADYFVFLWFFASNVQRTWTNSLKCLNFDESSNLKTSETLKTNGSNSWGHWETQAEAIWESAFYF